MTKEIFGVATKDGEPVITVLEAETTAKIVIGHMNCTLGSVSLRVLARRLHTVARRIEARAK